MKNKIIKDISFTNKFVKEINFENEYINIVKDLNDTPNININVNIEKEEIKQELKEEKKEFLTFDRYRNHEVEKYKSISKQKEFKQFQFLKNFVLKNIETNEKMEITHDILKKSKDTYLYFFYVQKILEEKYSNNNDYVSIFLTLTTPSRFHKYSSFNKIYNEKYDNETTINEAYRLLNDSFREIYKNFKINQKFEKIEYSKVIEPHENLTPHLHSIRNVKKEYLEEKEQNDILANFTIDSPIPFSLESLLEKLNAINSEMVPGARAGAEKAGDFNGKLSRMISRLENKISDKRMGFLFGGGELIMEFDWLNKLVETLIGVNSENSKAGIKIVDFSEVPSDILPLIVSLIARLSFSVQQWTKSEERHPIALLCDEAHLYIPNKSSSSSSDEISLSIFERIAKEGRKYGLSLVVISQRPSEVNRTVLSQCSNFIAMRLTNTDDQMVIKKLLPDNLGGFGDILPILDTGEALVVGDASLLPSRIRIDKPLKTPDSGTVEFWDEWQNNVKANRINNAVNNWRKQNIN